MAGQMPLEHHIGVRVPEGQPDRGNSLVNRMLKNMLWVGAVILVPGLGVALLAKKIIKDANDKQEFRDHVKKTYGYASHYQDQHDDH